MRRTEATTTTSVRHVAKPMGRNDENGPHLSDRAWFAALLDESRDDIAQACGDPGSFVDRNMDESVSRWSGRAVIAAIKQHAGDVVMSAGNDGARGELTEAERETLHTAMAAWAKVMPFNHLGLEYGLSDGIWTRLDPAVEHIVAERLRQVEAERDEWARKFERAAAVIGADDRLENWDTLLARAEKAEAALAEARQREERVKKAFGRCFEPDMAGVDWRDDTAIQAFAAEFVRTYPRVTLDGGDDA